MQIVILGKPISQMRPRLGKGVVYNPQSLMKKMVSLEMTRQVCELCDGMPEKLHQFMSVGSFEVKMTFYFKPAKSVSKSKRRAMLKNEVPCLVKQDLDNLEKFYCDCANNVLFEDDHQIVKMQSQKLWSEHERVMIEVKHYIPKGESLCPK
jgi:Holliday junction resolvase RusA-like endonuclease